MMEKADHIEGEYAGRTEAEPGKGPGGGLGTGSGTRYRKPFEAEHREHTGREYIVTFLPGQLPDEGLFGIEMAGITYPDGRYSIAREKSGVNCLEYVIRGEGWIETGGRVCHARQGDVYLLASGTKHRYYADEKNPWEKIWMNITGSLSDTLVECYGLKRRVLFENCPLYPLFQEFLRVCESRDSDRGRLAERTMLLFHEILLKLREREMARQQDGAASPDPALLIREYIDAHIYENITVRDLAETVSLSTSQMTRVFGKAFGQTPYEYVLGRKTDTACLLLRNTALSVKEIAYRLGFSDEHYFCNVFKKRVGMTPGRYRMGGETGGCEKSPVKKERF